MKFISFGKPEAPVTLLSPVQCHLPGALGWIWQREAMPFNRPARVHNLKSSSLCLEDYIEVGRYCTVEFGANI
ncbi:hypothetical protein CEXT_813651 [Caerostris extrusa]|uniref:Uncharacterized protein n=1 Tax=Caerostris extrusa TaxID=172846 RepID=A0AAV4XF41_CAEEX|nr:hypothetical protein CEXT_813651 [Caerostris extrusa]